MSKDRPNILFVFSDQQRYSAPATIPRRWIFRATCRHRWPILPDARSLTTMVAVRVWTRRWGDCWLRWILWGSPPTRSYITLRTTAILIGPIIGFRSGDGELAVGQFGNREDLAHEAAGGADAGDLDRHGEFLCLYGWQFSGRWRKTRARTARRRFCNSGARPRRCRAGTVPQPRPPHRRAAASRRPFPPVRWERSDPCGRRWR